VASLAATSASIAFSNFSARSARRVQINMFEMPGYLIPTASCCPFF